MVKNVVEKYAQSENFLNHRLIVVILLGFSGFLRISDLLDVRIKDVIFTQNDLQIMIHKAKNDQLREGHIVHIARTGSPYCPVYWTEKYINETDLKSDPDAYLICRLAKTKEGHRAIGKYRLSDTTIREYFGRDIKPICETLEEGSYSLHSLRSGGASTASNNGVSERLIGKHGRWKSGFSRDRYIKDSKKVRRTVSEALGL